MRKIILFALFAAFAMNYANAQKDRNYKYRPEGCEYTVVFPGKPELKEKYTESPTGKLMKYEEAQYFDNTSSSILVAESSPNFIDNQNSSEIKEMLIFVAKNNAERKGLEEVSIEYEENSLGKVASFIGYKNVSGMNMTFGGKFILGEYSIMIINYASKSTDYPTISITKFMDSVYR